jgi:TM2 domain-containing membrane protein YozV
MYSKGVAYLLWLLSGFGALGFHRFYLGKPLSGLLWMFTFGLAGIGSLYDLFTLGSQVDEANARWSMYSAAYRAGVNHTDDSAAASGESGGWRYVDDGSSRIVHEKNSMDKIILNLARRNGGIVTPSEVVLEGNVTLDNARRHLEKMVVNGHAQMRIRKSGVIVFTFPEFMDGDADFEDI